MAPTPKPPGQRRRRNTEQAKWKSLPAAGREGKAPTLPAKRPAWLKSTRDWWAEIWKSPMATAWVNADLGGLYRMARLKDDIERGTAPAVALAAVQQLEDRYGLNPKARRALQWEIEQASSGTERPQLASVTRIRAVDPAAA